MFTQNLFLLNVGLVCFVLACGKKPSTQKLDYSKSMKQSENLDAQNFTDLYKDQCANFDRVLSLRNDSIVEWIAIKNQTLPVMGHNRAHGYVGIEQDLVVANRATEFHFSPSSTETASKLRDDRIIEYFFEGIDAEISFKVDTITSPNGELSLPATGDSLTLNLEGNFAIANQKTNLSLPIVLTTLKDGFHLTNQETVTLDIVNQLNLSSQLTALMSLVEGVTMENQVEVKFSLYLDDICS